MLLRVMLSPSTKGPARQGGVGASLSPALLGCDRDLVAEVSAGYGQRCPAGPAVGSRVNSLSARAIWKLFDSEKGIYLLSVMFR